MFLLGGSGGGWCLDCSLSHIAEYNRAAQDVPVQARTRSNCGQIQDVSNHLNNVRRLRSRLGRAANPMVIAVIAIDANEITASKSVVHPSDGLPAQMYSASVTHELISIAAANPSEANTIGGAGNPR